MYSHTGIVFISYLHRFTLEHLELSKLADKWNEHMQFYKVGNLEMLQADIVMLGILQ